MFFLLLQNPGLPEGSPGGGPAGQHDQGDQGHHQGQEAVEDLLYLPRYCRTTVLLRIKCTFILFYLFIFYIFLFIYFFISVLFIYINIFSCIMKSLLLCYLQETLQEISTTPPMSSVCPSFTSTCVKSDIYCIPR